MTKAPQSPRAPAKHLPVSPITYPLDPYTREGTPMTNCMICGRDSNKAFACQPCADTARSNLDGIATLARHLSAKRARVGTSWNLTTYSDAPAPNRWRTDDSQQFGGVRARAVFAQGSEGLAYDPRVTDVANRVKNDLIGTVKVICESGRADIPARASLAELARFIKPHVDWLRWQQEAPTDFGQIERAHADLERLFDRVPDQVFLGDCHTDTEYGPCIEPLYAPKPAAGKEMVATVSCRRCNAQHETADRRAELMAAVDDYHGTAREISALLRNLAGDDVTVRMIYAYRSHGLVTAVGQRTERDKMGRQRDVDVFSIGAVRQAVTLFRAKGKADQRRIRHDAQTPAVAQEMNNG